MILRGYDDTHSCWLDDCHRHLHSVVETSQVVAVARFESMATSRCYGVTDGPILNHEGNYLLAVVTEVVSIAGDGYGTITLSVVGQDDVSSSIAPRYSDTLCHYSIVQLVLLVTVNDALVPSV